MRGAREHNLKDIHVELPRDALIVSPACPAPASPVRLRHDLRRRSAPLRGVP